MKKRMKLIGMILSGATLVAALGVSAGSTSELGDKLSSASLGTSSVSFGKVGGEDSKYDLQNVNEFSKREKEKAAAAVAEAESEEEAVAEVAEPEEVESEAIEAEVVETEVVETEAVTEEVVVTEAEVEIEETEAVETEEETEATTEEEETEEVAEAETEEEIIVAAEEEVAEEAANPYELAAMYSDLITEFRTGYTYDELLAYDVCFVDIDRDDVEEMIVRQAYAKDDFTTNGAFTVYKYDQETEEMGQIGTLEVPTFDLYMSEKEQTLAQVYDIQPTFVYYYNLVDGMLENGITMTYGNYEGADGAGKRVIERSEEVLSGTFTATLFSATPEDEEWEDADMIWNMYMSDLEKLEFSPLLVFLNTIALGTAPIA